VVTAADSPDSHGQVIKQTRLKQHSDSRAPVVVFQHRVVLQDTVYAEVYAESI